MKKILLSLVVVLFSLQLNAQEKVSEYSMSYFEDKTYNVEATEIKNGEFSYYIVCESWESNTDVVGIILDSDIIQEFINGMNEIKNKYVEWKNTAKQNNVTDFDKDFDISLPRVDCFFRYGDYHFSFNRTPNVYFKVTSDGECYAIFSIKNLTAADNQYIKHNGLLMVFASDKEFSEFIDAIDPKYVYEKSEKKSNTDSLFK